MMFAWGRVAIRNQMIPRAQILLAPNKPLVAGPISHRIGFYPGASYYLRRVGIYSPVELRYRIIT